MKFPLSRKIKKLLSGVLPNYIILTLLLVFSIAPLSILFLNSLKHTGEIALSPLGMPKLLHWDNFSTAWVEGRLGHAMGNSGIVIISTVLGVWLIAGSAAYALARLSPPGKDAVIMLLLVGSTLPAQAMVFIVYIIWARLHLTNSLVGLIPIYIASNAPFATILLRSFIVPVPKDFDDAAKVDGASDWQIFRHVIAPLTWPGFFTVGLLTALGVWNEFFLAVTFVREPSLQTIPIKLMGFISQPRNQDIGLISAASVITILPVLIIFLMLQRQFISGLTQGGLKG
jgi:raffinose/stachyose/melibiose transport system permease protein